MFGITIVSKIAKEKPLQKSASREPAACFKEVPLFWLNCIKTIFSNSLLSSELWYITYGPILSRTERVFFQSMLYTSYDVSVEKLLHSFSSITLILPVPILDAERKSTYVFIFILLCGASKGFKKAFKAFIKPFEAPQRSVRIKM